MDFPAEVGGFRVQGAVGPGMYVESQGAGPALQLAGVLGTYVLGSRYTARARVCVCVDRSTEAGTIRMEAHMFPKPCS